MKIQFIAITALIILTASGLKAQTSFSGTWAIKQKTVISGQDYANSIAKEITVSQTADSITISRTSMGQNGDVTSREAVAVSGKLNVIQTTANRKETVSLSMDTNSQGFTETATFSKESSAGEPEYQRIEVWSLSADGHALTIVKSFQSLVEADDKWSVKGVYEKQ